MSEKSYSLRRLVDLTVKWGSLLAMLFFAEYSVSALLEYYKGGNQSLLEIIFFLGFLIMFSLGFAVLTMFYPTLQKLLDNMFGDSRWSP